MFVMKKHSYKCGGGKVEEGECRIYRAREDSRWKWKEAEGRKKTTTVYS